MRNGPACGEAASVAGVSGRISCSPPLASGSLAKTALCAVLIALSACADKPAPLDNAFCRLFVRMPDPSDAIHLKKRENKVAILTNEQTFLHECSQNGGGLTPGPR